MHLVGAPGCTYEVQLKVKSSGRIGGNLLWLQHNADIKKIGPEVIPALPHQAVNKGKIGGLVSQVGTLLTTPKELPKLDPLAKNVGQNFLVLLTRTQQLY